MKAETVSSKNSDLHFRTDALHKSPGHDLLAEKSSNSRLVKSAMRTQETAKRIRVNPTIEPCEFARQVEAQIRENGGWLTAEEWEITAHYERFASCGSRTRALAWAKEKNADAIFGEAGYWHLARLRPEVSHDHG